MDVTMRKIGIMGGAFDPPHYAHLILAEHAYDELGLDKVLFVPTGASPHKDRNRTSVDHRLAMLRLAVEGNPRFEISRADIDRPGPHYSVEMVALLRSQYPDDEFTFIMGEDMFNDLPNWKRATELFSHGNLPVAVMRRLGSKSDLRHEMFAGLVVIKLASPLVEISSTAIVQRIQSGLSIRYLLPDAVLDYIEKNRLYRNHHL
jgi:nicotinate-nucleotide adenylyltransferase